MRRATHWMAVGATLGIVAGCTSQPIAVAQIATESDVPLSWNEYQSLVSTIAESDALSDHRFTNVSVNVHSDGEKTWARVFAQEDVTKPSDTRRVVLDWAITADRVNGKWENVKAGVMID